MPVSDTILISMGLLSIAIISAGLFRRSSIPFTVLLVIIGLVLSELANNFAFLKPLEQFQLTPDLVFFVFLPALIFESGLSLNARQLLKDLTPILTLAVPALLISTTLVGIGAWYLLDINFLTALLFGALISATDPVAVVALFKELGAPLRLNVLVEGESLFNDATAIVVFTILLTMITQDTQMDLLATGSAIIEFFRVFLGGIFIGALIGFIVSELLYRLHSNVSAVLTMSIVAAYASFIVGEHLLHVSGVMATVSAAVVLNVYGLTRLTHNVKPILSETWEFIGLIANSMLFLLVGLSINAITLFHNLDLILMIVIVIMLARAATIYSLVPATTYIFKLPKVSLAYRHIMWWGGLKGGLAIAIVLSIPETLPGRDLLITLTLGVVLFTLMVNALSIRPLMQKLKLDRLNHDEKDELKQAYSQALQSSKKMVEDYQQLELIDKTLAQQLNHQIEGTLNKEAKQLNKSSRVRRNYLKSLKIELNTLNELYAAGIINQYTLTDIRHTLQLDRDSHNEEHKKSDNKPIGKSIFQKIEGKLLKSIREKDWATSWLKRYQTIRLNQRIQRDIAGVAMSKAVADYFSTNQIKNDNNDLQLAQHRLKRRQQRLSELQQQFPQYYADFIHHLFAIASFKTAQIKIEDNFHHGEMGSKAFNKINQTISATLQLLNDTHVNRKTNIKKLIAIVPLFRQLSDQSISILAKQAQSITFLKDDIIIGQGEKGSSLYIIEQGVAFASIQQNETKKVVAEFSAGDFFGEMALLGDHVRSATVTAKSTITLLRLTEKDVLSLAEQNHDIKTNLSQAIKQRSKKTIGFN